jgi:tetratricopeptide (TPR) repeat protein
MKKALLLSLALLAAFPAIAVDSGSFTPARQPSVQDRLVRARQAVDAKDWNVAMRELNVALKEAPQDADVHNLLGYSYRRKAPPEMTKAYEHYNMALKINPDHKGAHEYIGEAYLQDRRLPEAEQHLVALQRICGGPACEEYQDLAKAIADYKARN